MTKFITTSATTSGNNIVATTSELYYIAEGVTRISTAGDGMTANVTGVSSEVLGNIFGNYGILFTTAAGNGDFSIDVGKNGSIVGNFAGILLGGNGNLVSNNGTITGFSTYGIYSVGDGFDLANSGTITSHSATAVVSSGGDARIVNYGLIQSLRAHSAAYGVDIADADPGADVQLRNYGTVSAAGGTAVHGDIDDVDRVWNFGTFDGGVVQGGGSDLFRNGGQVVGNVNLGAGADQFKGWDGTVDGAIHGRGGNDTIAGGISDDRIFGDNGADLLKGGQGDDTLAGGAGRDLMRGGPGFDAFDFNKAADSAAGAQRDHILDFSRADDIIDLHDIDAKTGVAGNQAFHFIGSDAFSGTKGELRSVNSGAGSKVFADVDGDGKAEFSILVEDVHNLHAGDFVL